MEPKIYLLTLACFKSTLDFSLGQILIPEVNQNVNAR